LEQLNLANHKVSIRFEWFYIDLNRPFIAVVHLHGVEWGINSTPIAKSSWHRVILCNQTTTYRNVQTKSEKLLGLFNTWPFDSYNINLFLGFNETVLLGEEHSLVSVGLGTSLQEMNTWDVEWSIEVLPRTPEHLTKSSNECNLTCFYKFRMSILRGSGYSLKNLAYFIPLFLIVVLLACCQIFYIPASRNYMADHLRIFLAFVAIIASSLFSVRTVTPPELTLVEFVFLLAGIGYTILLTLVLGKISRSGNHT